MRYISLIFGLAFFTVLTIRELYEVFVTSEGIRYFSSEPRRLLYVVLLAVAGGVVAFGISRFSPGSQRKLKLAALGAFGILLVGALAFFGYLIAMPALSDSRAGGWIGFFFLSMADALVWLEFRQVWRQTR
jgi:hypothetical protein